MSDVFGPHVGGRLGYSIVGHVYVGVYGGYNFGTISDTTRVSARRARSMRATSTRPLSPTSTTSTATPACLQAARIGACFTL